MLLFDINRLVSHDNNNDSEGEGDSPHNILRQLRNKCQHAKVRE